MFSNTHRIITAINHFLEGLFFGFCITTLLALLIWVFYKKKELRTFIDYSILVARNLAIFYFVLYAISLVIYYNSKEFNFFTERATGSYAWAYWFMLLRPLIFCGLLQLFWLKRIKENMRSISLIVVLVFIISLCSGPMFERFVIITASYSRDHFVENSQFSTDLFIIVASYLIEKTVLFSALVFISWAIFRRSKLE